MGGGGTQPVSPAGGDRPPADIAVLGTNSALVYPSTAPLARFARPRTWDFRAVWANVPQPVPTFVAILMYLHGHRGFVKVDKTGKCVEPDWAGPTLTAQYSPCSPLRYNLAAASDKSKAIFLAPEDTSPDDKMRNVPGSLGDKDGLAQFIGGSLARLRKLQRKSAAGADLGPYLVDHFSSFSRIHLSGHSGGGVPLAAALGTGSAFLDTFPIDAWLLDATYGGNGMPVAARDFLTRARTRGFLGTRKTDSRLVMIFNPDSGTEPMALDIIRDLTTVAPTFTVRVEPAAAGTQGLKPEDNAADAALFRKLIAQHPILVVRTRTAHDDIPKIYLPLLLDPDPTP